MNRFDRRHLPIKKKSIMGINGYVRNTSKQKVNSGSLVNSRSTNSVKVTAKKVKKEFNFDLLEAKIKSIEEKYEDRLFKLEVKVLEQQDTLDKIQKKDAMKQQMINSLKELNEKKVVNVEEDEEKLACEQARKDKRECTEGEEESDGEEEEEEEEEEVKELVSQEIEEKKKEQNVHLTIEE